MAQALRLTLPGGLWWNGRVETSVTLKPITGRVQTAILDHQHTPWSRPEMVTAILGEVIQSIGTAECEPQMAASLTVEDRQFLMLQLGILLRGDQMWLEADCTSCTAIFDISLACSALPVKSAGEGYPFTSVRLGGKTWRLSLPNGSDQALVQGLEDRKAVELLIRMCLTASEADRNEIDELVESLSEDEIGRIETALEVIAPVVVTRLTTQCPECHTPQTVQLDPYAYGSLDDNVLFNEIHTIAHHYHWSESEILDLTLARRSIYLKMIDESRGIRS